MHEASPGRMRREIKVDASYPQVPQVDAPRLQLTERFRKKKWIEHRRFVARFL